MIHLPASSRRGDPVAHIRLLTRVEPYADCGFGFHGRIYKPGAAIDPYTLPLPLVALECAGAIAGRNAPTTWILWRYDFDAQNWREICRCAARDWTWAVAIRPAAVRELLGPTPPPIDLDAVTERIVRTLDEELRALPPEMRPFVLSGLEAQVCGRLAAS